MYCVLGSIKTVNCALSLSAFCDFEISKAASFRCEMSNGSETYHFTQPVSAAKVAAAPPGLKFPAFVVSHFLSRQQEVPSLNLKIDISTDFPRQSGLGGSSALGVSLARGLGRAFSGFSEQGWQWSILKWIQDVEAAYLRVPTGTQDYLASLFGGLNSFTSQPGGIERNAFPDDVCAGFGERALVLFSGETHQSGMSNWELFKRAFDGETDMWDGLASIQQIAEQVDGEMRGHVNWKYVGQCLSEEWKIRRDVFKVQTSRLDEIVDFLRSKKVLGVKVCGAAQGGSLLALVDPAQKERIASECRAQSIQVLDARPEKSPVSIQTL